MTTLVEPVTAEVEGVRPGLFKRMVSEPRAVLSLTILLIIALASIFAPWIAPHDYREPAGIPLKGTGLLGTDDYGRDVWSRLLIAGRVSLGVSAGAVVIAGSIGTLAGLLAGFMGGWISSAVMRAMDILLSFPAIVLAIAVVAALGPGLRNLILVIGVLYIPRFARLVYSTTLSVRPSEYVAADVSMGATPQRIMTRTVLPNILAPIVVQLSVSLTFAIQIEAGLSFLGLGAQPPTPSWGTMIATGRNFLEVRPMILIAPSAVIVVTVLCLNLIGDSLRDLLDPRQR